MNYAKGIKTVRERLGGHTGRDLARLLGVSNVHISKIENNKSKPSLDLLESVAMLYKISFPVFILLCSDLSELKEKREKDEKVLSLMIEDLICKLKGSEKIKDVLSKD